MFSTPVYTVPILADATLPFLVPVIELALTVIDGAVGAVLSISIVIGVTSPIKFPDKSWQDPVIIPTVCVVDPVFETTTLYSLSLTFVNDEIFPFSTVTSDSPNPFTDLLNFIVYSPSPSYIKYKYLSLT